MQNETPNIPNRDAPDPVETDVWGPACPGQKGQARALDVDGVRAYVSPTAAGKGDGGAWMWTWGPYAGRGTTAEDAQGRFREWYEAHTAAQAAQDAP